MNTETTAVHITPVGGNVFADIGFEPEEAAALKEWSQRGITEKLAIKDTLMTQIAAWIDSEKLNQDQAAQVLGVSRARIADVIHKRGIKFTRDSLVNMLARTGKHVEISVR